MAADEPDNGSGSKDRATVALVGAKVDEIKAIIEGHAKVTEKSLEGLQREIDHLVGLPLIVNGLVESMKAMSSKLRDHDQKFTDLETDEKRRREYRVGPLVANLVGFAGVIVAVIAVVVAAHG